MKENRQSAFIHFKSFSFVFKKVVLLLKNPLYVYF